MPHEVLSGFLKTKKDLFVFIYAYVCLYGFVHMNAVPGGARRTADSLVMELPVVAAGQQT